MDALLEYNPAILLTLGVIFSLLIGALILTVSTRAELRHVNDSYNTLIEYLGDDKSRDLLHELASLIRGIEHDNRITEMDIAQIYALLEYCVQKVAVVRYNAFHNVGSDQSFSVALLDSGDSGVVISGIYGRDTSTTYAKPIQAGASDYVLTEEEESAIALARQRYRDTSYYRAGKQGDGSSAS